jgi:hypothetical protein
VELNVPDTMEVNKEPKTEKEGEAKAAAPAEKQAKAVAAPAEEKKPAANPKAPAKPAKKPAEPFVDNEDGTITDPNSGLIWKKTDAWIDTHKFYLWNDHREYVEQINTEKFAGFDSWRVPSKAEASTIFNKEKECIDKNGSVYYIDPIFERGGVGNTWIIECSDEKIIRYDFKTGVDTPYPPADIWASIRLVRKEGDPSNLSGGSGEPTVAATEGQAETTEAATAVAPTASATVAPESFGGGKKGPLKNKKAGGITDAERAEMLKNAKAHAANRKKG